MADRKESGCQTSSGELTDASSSDASSSDAESGLFFLRRRNTTQRLLNDTTLECYDISKELIKWGITDTELTLLNSSSHRRVLKKSIRELLHGYPQVFASLWQQLQLEDINDVKKAAAVLNAVSDEMLSDNLVNWGRIVCLHAFALCLLRRLRALPGSPYNDVDSPAVAEFIKEFAKLSTSKFAPWIVAQGGWDNLTSHFGNVDPVGQVEDTIYKGLLFTGLGLLGVIAFFAYRL